jgi:methylmalonyl-CoA/ethylmalonyl-CoA epimerase
MSKVVNIHHIGIIVPNIEKSLKFWQDILGIELDYVENVYSMNLDLAWLPVDKTRIELLQPTSQEANEYYEFLRSRGPGVHHICLEVDNIDEMLLKLKEKHVGLKNETAITLPGRRLAFLEPEGTDGVIVELYELQKPIPIEEEFSEILFIPYFL